MSKIKTLRTALFILFCLITISFIQTNNSLYSFSMQAPKEWHETTNKEIINNIGKIKLSDTELDKYLSDHKGSTLIVSYSKYKQSEHAGLIPTIQVNLRKNTTSDFDKFFKIMSKSAHDMKQYLQNYEFIETPDSVIIGGKKSVFFSAKFTLKMKNGEIIKARSKTYAVPTGDNFYQINFTDGEKDDCSVIFNDLIKTIKF